MPKMVRVPALKTFTYHGREFHPGHHVDMRSVDAAAAARAGNVSLTSVYHRRDMAAAAPVPAMIMTTHPVTSPQVAAPVEPVPVAEGAAVPAVEVEQPRRRGRPRKVVEDVTAGVRVSDEEANPEPTPTPVLEPEPEPVVQVEGAPLDSDRHES
jgi:hypothetical protein